MIGTSCKELPYAIRYTNKTRVYPTFDTPWLSYPFALEDEHYHILNLLHSLLPLLIPVTLFIVSISRGTAAMFHPI